MPVTRLHTGLQTHLNMNIQTNKETEKTIVGFHFLLLGIKYHIFGLLSNFPDMFHVA